MNIFTTETRTSPLEARLFRAFWDDGLIDLFFGLGAMAIGICWATGLVALGALIPAVLVPFWSPLRRKLIEPRAGIVKFARARAESNRRMLRTAFLIGLGSLTLFTALFWFAGPGQLDIIRTFIAGVPAILVGAVACLVVLGLRIARFLLHALVFATCGVAIALIDGNPAVAIIAGGAIVALSGTWILIRFLRAEIETEEG